MARVYMQVGPSTWAFVTEREPPKASDLPRPNVISDIMPPTEQVDGKFYTSKAEFRRVGRSLGLTEVGTEKPKPKQRASSERVVKEGRIKSIKKAIEQYQSGRRVQIPGQPN